MRQGRIHTHLQFMSCPSPQLLHYHRYGCYGYGSTSSLRFCPILGCGRTTSPQLSQRLLSFGVPDSKIPRRDEGSWVLHVTTSLLHMKECVCVCVFEGTIVHVILSATWKYDLQPEVSRSFGLKKDSAAKKGPSIRKVSSRGRREPENKTTTNPNAKTA